MAKNCPKGVNGRTTPKPRHRPTSMTKKNDWKGGQLSVAAISQVPMSNQRDNTTRSTFHMPNESSVASIVTGGGGGCCDGTISVMGGRSCSADELGCMSMIDFVSASVSSFTTAVSSRIE
mmetsp:Transcript_50549/g.132675  ORF Transcript_50549/g.132675 Transcript_50549/m.132675 type:complete len:120 (+) Transcript_50549:260-619(+)